MAVPYRYPCRIFLAYGNMKGMFADSRNFLPDHFGHKLCFLRSQLLRPTVLIKRYKFFLHLHIYLGRRKCRTAPDRNIDSDVIGSRPSRHIFRRIEKNPVPRLCLKRKAVPSFTNQVIVTELTDTKGKKFIPKKGESVLDFIFIPFSGAL